MHIFVHFSVRFRDQALLSVFSLSDGWQIGPELPALVKIRCVSQGAVTGHSDWTMWRGTEGGGWGPQETLACGFPELEAPTLGLQAAWLDRMMLAT